MEWQSRAGWRGLEGALGGTAIVPLAARSFSLLFQRLRLYRNGARALLQSLLRGFIAGTLGKLTAGGGENEG